MSLSDFSFDHEIRGIFWKWTDLDSWFDYDTRIHKRFGTLNNAWTRLVRSGIHAGYMYIIKRILDVIKDAIRQELYNALIYTENQRPNLKYCIRIPVDRTDYVFHPTDTDRKRSNSLG